jgi:tetratricopeptide (TPR) repeat protein
VADTTAPSLTCPANISASAPSQSGTVVNYTATASDACSAAAVTCTPPSGSTFPVGMTTVNCTATDAQGNAATCSFLVTVTLAGGPRTTKQACLTDLIALRDSRCDGSAPPQSWVDDLNLAKSMVSDLQTETEALQITGNNAAQAKADLLAELSSAQAKLQVSSSANTIYDAALDVYDYIRELYRLASKHQITAADRDRLAGLATDAFNQIIVVYLSHPDFTQAPAEPSKSCKKLDEAIYQLQKSLDPALWVDDSHLQPKHGSKVFDRERQGVKKLQDLINDKNNDIPEDTLLGFIRCFTGVDRQLAETAIEEAPGLGVKPKKIEKARQELAKGDAEAAKGHYDHAIDHYKHAWEQTARVRIDPMPMAGGGLRLEFYVNDEVPRDVEASTDLIHWIKIGTAQPDPDGVVTFDVPNASQYPTRFYRVIEE